jgi:hypothetical protein
VACALLFPQLLIVYLYLFKVFYKNGEMEKQAGRQYSPPYLQLKAPHLANFWHYDSLFHTPLSVYQPHTNLVEYSLVCSMDE